MRIAIIGGSGFIGKWFIKEFGDKYKCVIFGRRKDVNELKIAGEKYKYIRTDFSKDQLVKQLEGFDAVIHLAAKRFEPQEKMEEYLQNIKISSNLFEACKTLGIKNVIHLSTIGVYSAEEELPWTESQNVNPSTFYAISKLAIEKVANYYNKKHKMKIKNLRVAQVLGVGEREGFMLSVFLEKALDKKTLTVYGKGEGRREYIYVKDVVNAIQRALEVHNEEGIFNIGINKNISHKELAETINKVFENSNNIKILNEYSEDKSIQLMSIDKAKQMLKWRSHWTLKEALFDMKTILINDS
ncbi:MAG: NAD(P)-dependent oxidoreductase [Methanomassiliicoccales archaeon]|nr:MAG: NAD(P)-dependent oxidoreductase [Methanomassiliicoccales archaeon]